MMTKSMETFCREIINGIELDAHSKNLSNSLENATSFALNLLQLPQSTTSTRALIDWDTQRLIQIFQAFCSEVTAEKVKMKKFRIATEQLLRFPSLYMCNRVLMLKFTTFILSFQKNLSEMFRPHLFDNSIPLGFLFLAFHSNVAIRGWSHSCLHSTRLEYQAAKFRFINVLAYSDFINEFTGAATSRFDITKVSTLKWHALKLVYDFIPTDILFPKFLSLPSVLSIIVPEISSDDVGFLESLFLLASERFKSEYETISNRIIEYQCRKYDGQTDSALIIAVAMKSEHVSLVYRGISLLKETAQRKLLEQKLMDVLEKCQDISKELEKIGPKNSVNDFDHSLNFLRFCLKRDLSLIEKSFCLEAKQVHSIGNEICQSFYQSFIENFITLSDISIVQLENLLDILAVQFRSFRVTSFAGEDFYKPTEYEVRQFAKGCRGFMLKFLEKIFTHIKKIWSNACRDLLITKLRSENFVLLIFKCLISPMESLRQRSLDLLTESRVTLKSLYDNLDFDSLFGVCNEVSKMFSSSIEDGSYWQISCIINSTTIISGLCSNIRSYHDFLEENELLILSEFVYALLVSVLMLTSQKSNESEISSVKLMDCFRQILDLTSIIIPILGLPLTQELLFAQEKAILKILFKIKGNNENSLVIEKSTSFLIDLLFLNIEYKAQTPEEVRSILRDCCLLPKCFPLDKVTKILDLQKQLFQDTSPLTFFTQPTHETNVPPTPSSHLGYDIVSSNYSMPTQKKIHPGSSQVINQRPVSESELWHQMQMAMNPRKEQSVSASHFPMPKNSFDSFNHTTANTSFNLKSGTSAMSKLKDDYKRERLRQPIQSIPKNSRSSSSLSTKRKDIMHDNDDDHENSDGYESGISLLLRDTSQSSVKMSIKGKEYSEPRKVRMLETSDSPSLPKTLLQNPRSWTDAVKNVLYESTSRFYSLILPWDYWKLHIETVRARKQLKSTFSGYQDYVNGFEPLLLDECKANLSRAKEDAMESESLIKMRVDSVAHVDQFTKLTMTCQYGEGRYFDLNDTDIVCLAFKISSESFIPAGSLTSQTSKDEKDLFKSKKEDFEYIFAKVDQIHLTNLGIGAGIATLRIWIKHKQNLAGVFRSGLFIHGLRLCGISTIEREFQAIHASRLASLSSQLYDPSKRIFSPKSSEETIERLKNTLRLNYSQAKTVVSVSTLPSGFVLVQGPPGTGKTTLILGCISNLLLSKVSHKYSNSARKSHEHLLVCAPSNAAVDELVRRLRRGILAPDGTKKRLKIVRFGTVEGVHASVRDFALEQQVETRTMAHPEYTKLLPKDESGKETSTVYGIKKQLEDLRKEIGAQMDLLDSMDPSDDHLSAVERNIDALSDKQAQLRSALNQKVNQKDRNRKILDGMKGKLRVEILNSADVLLCTLSMSGHDQISQHIIHGFDTVIIDEACQATEVSCLVPLRYNVKKCILVGDPNQLPPTVLSLRAQDGGYDSSLFNRLMEYQDVELLEMQYRMHPQISMFPNDIFYDRRLKDGPGLQDLNKRPWHSDREFGPFLFYDLQNAKESSRKKSHYNDVEVGYILSLYEKLLQKYQNENFKGKIGIITPYKEQKKRLIRGFVSKFGDSVTENVEINTVDGFQGQEKEIIMVSCVRANRDGNIGFLSDIRRLNVAITRAKCSLWIIGNSDSLVGNGTWQKLIQHAKFSNCYISTSFSK